jgi:S-disulfanyl-L-cysteine oxidoreductase SoxD
VRRRALAIAAVAWAAAIASGGSVRLAAQAPPSSIWQGVYTAAQAERGKGVFSTACVRCHGADLSGTTAPSLKGDRFMNAWGGETLTRLFEKIRDTMPPNFGTILGDATKLDIVTYILQSNGYPAGAKELSLGTELAAIQILRQGEQATVQNFTLVRAVGCLVRGDDNAWLLRRSSEPVVTTENAPGPDALAAAAARPLGSGSFVLVSVSAFEPEAHRGQKMEARGLIYQEPGESLLTLTSLQSLGACEG